MKNLSSEVSSFLFWGGRDEKYYERQISEHSLTEGLYARSKKVHKSVNLILKHHNTIETYDPFITYQFKLPNPRRQCVISYVFLGLPYLQIFFRKLDI